MSVPTRVSRLAVRPPGTSRVFAYFATGARALDDKVALILRLKKVFVFAPSVTFYDINEQTDGILSATIEATRQADDFNAEGIFVAWMEYNIQPGMAQTAGTTYTPVVLSSPLIYEPPQPGEDFAHEYLRFGIATNADAFNTYRFHLHYQMVETTADEFVRLKQQRNF